MGDAPDRKKEEKKSFIDCCGVGGKKLGTYAMPVNAGSALGLPGNGRSILIQAFGTSAVPKVCLLGFLLHQLYIYINT